MAKPSATDPGEDLSRFRYHTGATLRRLEPDEPCRLLFRDIGPSAMAHFLRGRLKRLAGPFAPILYTRTAEYHEPYVDYEPVGRLVFLQPKLLTPWYSGVPTIFVASLRQRVDPQTVGFLPADVHLADAERQLQGAADVASLREAMGGACYDEAVGEALATLDRVNAEHAESEQWAEPLRRKLQSRQHAEAQWARDWLAGHGLSESDLCTAWHHLPRERRDRFRDAVRGLGEVRPC
jgi:hypothetical protein